MEDEKPILRKTQAHYNNHQCAHIHCWNWTSMVNFIQITRMGLNHGRHPHPWKGICKIVFNALTSNIYILKNKISLVHFFKIFFKAISFHLLLNIILQSSDIRVCFPHCIIVYYILLDCITTMLYNFWCCTVLY